MRSIACSARQSARRSGYETVSRHDPLFGDNAYVKSGRSKGTKVVAYVPLKNQTLRVELNLD